MEEICQGEEDVEKNPALRYAAIRNILYRKGFDVEILSSFKYGLHYFSEWWKQLYGESEGKEGKGILPYNLSFTTDLHSLGQYVQQGKRHIFETMISVEKSANEYTVPQDANDTDGLNYIAGRTLTYVNNNAQRGTIAAHADGGVPVVEVRIEQIDEEVLGEMIYMFEYACAVSGYMLGVNPFDQPGVEAYKTNMFRLLGKPGYTK